METVSSQGIPRPTSAETADRLKHVAIRLQSICDAARPEDREAVTWCLVTVESVAIRLSDEPQS